MLQSRGRPRAPVAVPSTAAIDVTKGPYATGVVLRCLFCANTGSVTKITKEHLYGDWLNSVLPAQPRLRARVSEVLDRRTGQVARRDMEVPQHRHEIQLRCVCQICNNGWMSDMEATTQRVASPMMLGSTTSVSAEDAAGVAAWMTKIAMLQDFWAEPKTRSIPLWHRQFLRERRHPPPRTLVWCAELLHMSEWRNASRHLSLLVMHGPEQRTGYLANTYVSTAGFGRLLLLSVGTTSQAVELRDLAVCFPRSFVRLWPDPASFLWPPSRPTTDAQVWQLSEGDVIVVGR